ncbi:hypothetical protein GCM10008014_32350 [Paenibacillus silvae]|uniref:GNAT family N-acetyltransferase n=1 Tax=Paenibacillus silvae TaxID=1325358 RepID=A0ABQ1ZFV9_9BACL|nr:hypothetical protein [Paenibacillus silvae]GGH59091.1 hypothetical protein GCM10008014_32350 [Paenibacillus silvae]
MSIITRTESVIIQDELVLRCVEPRDLAELYELIYGEDEPEWKRWDAPYYPLERVSYEHFEQNTFKRLRADEEEARPASIRVVA